MTYPGLQGQVGPAHHSSEGFQVRQSRAGGYPGTVGFANVIDSMGSHAPASAVVAAAVTVRQEVTANPHPIEAENFELDFDQAPDFGSAADYTGKGGS